MFKWLVLNCLLIKLFTFYLIKPVDNAVWPEFYQLRYTVSILWRPTQMVVCFPSTTLFIIQHLANTKKSDMFVSHVRQVFVAKQDS